MDAVTLVLTAEEAEDLREALKVAIDALELSDRTIALCAHVGPEECATLDAKIVEATR